MSNIYGIMRGEVEIARRKSDRVYTHAVVLTKRLEDGTSRSAGVSYCGSLELARKALGRYAKRPDLVVEILPVRVVK